MFVVGTGGGRHRLWDARARSRSPEAAASASEGIDGGAGADGAADARSMSARTYATCACSRSSRARCAATASSTPASSATTTTRRRVMGAARSVRSSASRRAARCGTPGPCISVPVCGNGVLDADEACDDGNKASGDGCAGDCATITPGWRCPVVGRRCVPDLRRRPDGRTRDVRRPQHDVGRRLLRRLRRRAEHRPLRRRDHLGRGGVRRGGCQQRCVSTSSCTTHCRFGAFCGDGVVNVGGGVRQREPVQQRDVRQPGRLRARVASIPHFCGDAIVDFDDGEQCDFGPINGSAILVLLAGLQGPALTTSAPPARLGPRPVGQRRRPSSTRAARTVFVAAAPTFAEPRTFTRAAWREQPVVRPPAVVGP